MSQTAAWYMELTRQIIEGIAPRTNPKIGEYIEEIEGLEGPDIGFLQVGYAYWPHVITTQSYIERSPYSNPESHETHMDAAVERGWLEQVSPGGYKLSQKGYETTQRFMQMGSKLFGDLQALSDGENSRIADLLAKLVKAAYQLPEPAAKPSMQIGIRLDPGVDAAPMLRIRRYLTDLNYYREDVHIAAWKPFYQVDGRVFETLTQLWENQASSPAGLAETLSAYRSYDEADYAAALDELVGRGWAEQSDQKYQITEAGQALRQEAEDRTDQYFARPFSALSQAETEELKGLLEKLAGTLKAPEERHES